MPYGHHRSRKSLIDRWFGTPKPRPTVDDLIYDAYLAYYWRDYEEADRIMTNLIKREIKEIDPNAQNTQSKQQQGSHESRSN